MKERLLWADALKGLLILFVVFGHSIQFLSDNFASSRLWTMIYSFHNSGFMAVSGYFSFNTIVRVRGGYNSWGG